MPCASNTTIVAIATPRGNGGVAIIRLSGPQSWAMAHRLCPSGKPWQAGRIVHTWLVHPTDRMPLDEVILLPFRAPRSFTGEDVIEIHCHGGWALANLIVQHCLALGAQPAEPGEFTKRALLNGRMDVTQAEATLDLIEAQGETLLKLAAYNLQHRSLRRDLEQLWQALVELQAPMVASMDFPDEVEEPDRTVLTNGLRHLENQLKQQLQLNQKAQVIRQGMTVALAGRPNAGKSALFNALLQYERSIVTDIAGTTRDTIHETLIIKGIPVTLVDTAGLRETRDVVERMGVERTQWAVAEASLILYIVDCTVGLTTDDRRQIEKLSGTPAYLVWNKADVIPGWTPPSLEAPFQEQILVSALEKTGLTELLGLVERALEHMGDFSQLTYVLSARQLSRLSAVQQELSDAIATLENPALPLDLATVPLSQALLTLEGLMGKESDEVVLDSVFERFCVGK